MPRRPPRPCRAAGCRGLTVESHGYCEDHEHLASGWARPGRGSAASRGYDWRWKKRRDRIMVRDRHLCQTCWRAGRIVPAAEVDHIVPKVLGGDDEDDNLEAICVPCHKVKTARDQVGARSETHRKT